MKIQPHVVTDIFDATYPKPEGLPCFLFNPQGSVEMVCVDKDSFMVPTYRVKRDDVEAWIKKIEAFPPNPLGLYEGVTVTYNDLDGGEPRYGAAVYRISYNQV